MGLTLQLSGEDSAPRVHAESRRAVLEDFKFDDAPKPPDSEEPIEEKSPSADEVPPDTVVMERFEIKERKIEWDLAADIKKTRPLGPQSKSKWGTGVHQKDFGKTRVSVVTILYVPIQINASW